MSLDLGKIYRQVEGIVIAAYGEAEKKFVVVQLSLPYNRKAVFARI